MEELPIKGKGECKTCDDVNHCPMKEVLPKHLANVAVYGEYYKNERPDLWDEESVDEPEIEDGEVTWCPMHHIEEGKNNV